MDETMSITQVAAVMMTKMTDAVLFQDPHEPGRVTGILTDTDIMKRVLGATEELYANETAAGDVMTRDPASCTPNSHGLDALNTMVQGRFRHLPVVADDGKVVGVLDLARCVYDALANLETMFSRAQSFADILMEDVEGTAESIEAKTRQEAYFNRVQSGVLQPTVEELCSMRELVWLPPHGTVREAAEIMKRTEQSAILIMGDDGGVLGIVTSKDIVKRVVAKGCLDSSYELEKMMTPYPDTVEPSMSVMAALHKMHRNVYTHLPVVDPQTRKPIGVVDTVQVTRYLYESIHTVRRTCNLNGLSDLWKNAYPENDEVGANDEDDMSDLLSQLSSNIGREDLTSDLQSLAQPAARSESRMSSLHGEGEQLLPAHLGLPPMEESRSMQPRRGVFRIAEPTGNYSIQRDCCYNGLEGLKRALRDKLILSEDAQMKLTWRDEAGVSHLQDDRDLQDAIIAADASGARLLRVQVRGAGGKMATYGSLEENLLESDQIKGLLIGGGLLTAAMLAMWIIRR